MIAKNGKISRFFDRVITGLHYNLRKAVNIYIAVLMIVPVAYFAYVALALNMNNMGLEAYFRQSPITTVMFIVTLMDLIVAYVLYFRKPELLTNRMTVIVTFSLLTFLQLMVGNIISVILGLIVLYLSKNIMPSRSTGIDKQTLAVIIGSTPFYLICTWLLFTIGVK
ncbi:hypothetical protein RA086_13750 [Lactiplantibacillus sp. WILCCON 0030]|uniref:Uncharacterized protein n=1 Tax=Lactiplantibacillus brownii TaxID=3069269 RepID=A0ABU1ACM8_9LACO|nr:hypothetical protein [Lactiplantibacillus brownii]MDQ7938674.1 hypothetical protein [Lactiplantibacillus brownii]